MYICVLLGAQCTLIHSKQRGKEDDFLEVWPSDWTKLYRLKYRTCNFSWFSWVKVNCTYFHPQFPNTSNMFYFFIYARSQHVDNSNKLLPVPSHPYCGAFFNAWNLDYLSTKLYKENPNSLSYLINYWEKIGGIRVLLVTSVQNFGSPCTWDNQKSRQTKKKKKILMQLSDGEPLICSHNLPLYVYTYIFQVRTTKNLYRQPEILTWGHHLFFLNLNTACINSEAVNCMYAALKVKPAHFRRFMVELG